MKIVNNKIDKKEYPFLTGRYFRNMERRTKVIQRTENKLITAAMIKLKILRIPGIVNRMPVGILMPSKGCFSVHMNFIGFRMIY
jgi:hypothetical protein